MIEVFALQVAAATSTWTSVEPLQPGEFISLIQERILVRGSSWPSCKVDALFGLVEIIEPERVESGVPWSPSVPQVKRLLEVLDDCILEEQPHPVQVGALKALNGALSSATVSIQSDDTTWVQSMLDRLSKVENQAVMHTLNQAQTTLNQSL